MMADSQDTENLCCDLKCKKQAGAICAKGMVCPQICYVMLCNLQEENFHIHLNFPILLMTNSLNLNLVYYFIFSKLSMIAYLIEIHKSKFANISFILSPVAKLNSMYIFIM